MRPSFSMVNVTGTFPDGGVGAATTNKEDVQGGRPTNRRLRTIAPKLPVPNPDRCTEGTFSAVTRRAVARGHRRGIEGIPHLPVA
jgi:hypothetical protein